MYKTIKLHFEDDVCYLELNRPSDDNAINNIMIEELSHAITICHQQAKILVLEGQPSVFCVGADFNALVDDTSFESQGMEEGPRRLYDLWYRLATGPYISIAHVRGPANAGGVGMAAACDVVLANVAARFTLSELLFGLMPACVLPFLIRKVGLQNSHQMTLSSKTVSVEGAKQMGLVDDYAADSRALLRKYLARYKRLSKKAITRYKNYIFKLDASLDYSKGKALAANYEVFSDEQNLQSVRRFVSTGQFPWE